MKGIWIVAAAMCLPANAYAADLGKPAYRPASLKDAPPQPPAYDTPAYNWSGLYGGGFIGGAFADEPAGIAGGIWVGYNWQLGGNFVYGLETGIGLTDAAQQNRILGVNVTSNIGLFGSVRGRAGIAVDRTLFYATAGLAWANIDRNAGPLIVSRDETAVGYVVGGGIEYAFDNSWTGRAEYLYSNYGDQTLINRAGNRAGLETDMSLLRVGLSHKF